MFLKSLTVYFLIAFAVVGLVSNNVKNSNLVETLQTRSTLINPK